MYIIKTRKENAVTVFYFDRREDLDKACRFLGKTNAEWFAAEVKHADSRTGHIIQKEDGCYGKTLSYVIQNRAYRDYVYAVLGTEGDCKKAAAEKNAQVRCWADMTAEAEPITGDLWQVVYTDPYKD